MNAFKKFAALLLALMMILSLAACGSKSDDSAQGSSDGDASPDDTAKSKIEQIKEAGVLVMGTSADYPPNEFHTEVDGKDTIVGFDVAIAQYIADDLGVELKVVDMSFDNLCINLAKGDFDIVIAGMASTEERLKSVDFSDPYYESGLTMVVREDEQNIKTFSDLKGKKIAVQIGTTSAKEAKKIEGAEVKELNTPADCFMELKNGGVDAVVNDRPVNDYYIHKSGQTGVKTLPERLTSEDYGIAVAKGNKELAEKINAALKKLKENGEYDKIFAKWFGAQK